MASCLLLFAVVWVASSGHPASLAVFGLAGVAGASPLIGRGEHGWKPLMDERDQQIAQFAALGSFGVFYVCFVLAAVIPLFVLGPSATITLRISTITGLAFPAMILVFGVRAFVTVILYRRGGADGRS
jgi:hypothetical protein